MRFLRRIWKVACGMLAIYISFLYITHSDGYSISDYVYVMYINFESIELYHRSSFDVILVIVSLLSLCLGMNYILSDLREMGRGMYQWAMLRQGTVSRYIRFIQRRCFVRGLQYQALIVVCFGVSLLLVHPQAYLIRSEINPFSWRQLMEILLLSLRYMLLTQILGILGLFLLRNHRYEVFLGGMTIVCTVLLAVDAFGFVCFRIAPVPKQIEAIVVLGALYGIGRRQIGIYMKRRDM